MKKNTIFNLCWYKATEEQEASGVFEPPKSYKNSIREKLIFTAKPNKGNLKDRAKRLAEAVKNSGREYALIDDCPNYLAYYLIKELKKEGITPIISFRNKKFLKL